MILMMLSVVRWIKICAYSLYHVSPVQTNNIEMHNVNQNFISSATGSSNVLAENTFKVGFVRPQNTEDEVGNGFVTLMTDEMDRQSFIVCPSWRKSLFDRAEQARILHKKTKQANKKTSKNT